jgi:hypothetical protein
MIIDHPKPINYFAFWSVGNPGKVGHSKGRILLETALITQGFGAGKSDIARLSDAGKPPLRAEAFPDLASDRTKAVSLNRRLACCKVLFASYSTFLLTQLTAFGLAGTCPGSLICSLVLSGPLSG